VLELRWPAPLHARVVREGVDPIQGWISHDLDEKGARGTPLWCPAPWRHTGRA
jgi:hypothetical protein